jgi:preprotein translocase subunit SecE
MSTPENTNPQPAARPLETVAATAASAPASTPAPAAVAPPASKASLQERRLFNFYRPEDGHRARAVIGIAIAVITLYGCHALWDWLPKGTEDFWGKHLFDLGDEQFTVNPAVALALFLAVSSLIAVFKLVNYPRFVDFLIDTENELKKVSWASRRQVISESVVVLSTVILIGAYVFLVDMLLQLVKRLDWDFLLHKLGLG